jgi:uracil-DNA glycosylase family 4
MFVGEAPGADEDAGVPFVGRAGQLTKIIEAIGLGARICASPT